MDKYKDIEGKAPSRAVGLTRLAIFMLVPVYVIWSLKVGSWNPFAWPQNEQVGFAILQILWMMAWGASFFAMMRRIKLAREFQEKHGLTDADLAAVEPCSSSAEEESEDLADPAKAESAEDNSRAAS